MKLREKKIPMSKIVKILLVLIASVLLLSLAFGMGCILSFNDSPAQGLDTGLLNQTWAIISRNYVEPDSIDPTSLNQGAIRGIIQSLDDPYSYYLDPETYSLTQSTFQSRFGGIGASVTVNNDKQPVIVAPLPDTPAARAGIKTGDIILAVDDRPTEGLSLTETVLLIRGPVGTPVRVLILREGETTPLEVELVREEINPATVDSEMKENIAYIQITNFYESTGDEVQAALRGLDLNKADGIILDLRDNTGGLVTTVVDVASHFIKEGVIITQRDNQGRTVSVSVNPKSVFTDLPVVVLVNQYSASGSEVLAGAFQDYNRATIAGTITLGKGSYDAFFQLQDGSAIYLTIGRWLTPNGREIEGEGITPDYILTETDEEAIQWAIDFLNTEE